MPIFLTNEAGKFLVSETGKFLIYEKGVVFVSARRRFTVIPRTTIFSTVSRIVGVYDIPEGKDLCLE